MNLVDVYKQLQELDRKLGELITCVRFELMEQGGLPVFSLNERERAFVLAGKKIEAIKALRVRLDCSLLDARDAVDQYAVKAKKGVT